MAKKKISDNAEKLGANDVETTGEAVKFISEFREQFFMMPVLDENGKQVLNTDAEGNKETKAFKRYDFVKVDGHKNKDGKIDPTTAFSFFICDPEKQGADYKRFLDKLTALSKNPINKMYTADDHFKRRNPEAFRIAREKQDLEEKLSEKDRLIEELNKKLGFKRN
jgi:hypothetical protein